MEGMKATSLSLGFVSEERGNAIENEAKIHFDSIMCQMAEEYYTAAASNIETNSTLRF